MTARGSANPNWRGGRVRGGGDMRYWMVHTPGHPYASKTGYVLEHRLVAEKKIGRLLERHEVVHHLNGDTGDNRAENLEITTQSEHARGHYDDVLRHRGYRTPPVLCDHVCEQCDTAFTTTTTATLRQRFCNRACYLAYRRGSGVKLAKGAAA